MDKWFAIILLEIQLERSQLKLTFRCHLDDQIPSNVYFSLSASDK